MPVHMSTHRSLHVFAHRSAHVPVHLPVHVPAQMVYAHVCTHSCTDGLCTCLDMCLHTCLHTLLYMGARLCCIHDCYLLVCAPDGRYGAAMKAKLKKSEATKREFARWALNTMKVVLTSPAPCLCCPLPLLRLACLVPHLSCVSISQHLPLAFDYQHRLLDDLPLSRLDAPGRVSSGRLSCASPLLCLCLSCGSPSMSCAPFSPVHRLSCGLPLL